MLPKSKRQLSWCVPLVPLLFGCGDAASRAGAPAPSSSVEGRSIVVQRGGAAGESIVFELPESAHMTPDDVLGARESLALGPKDELRLFRSSAESNGYSTRNYRLYRDGARVEGAALTLTLHGDFVVEGAGWLTATSESPGFAVAESEAWTRVASVGAVPADATKTKAERVLVPRANPQQHTAYSPAYRFDYTAGGTAEARSVVVSAWTGEALPDPRLVGDLANTDTQLFASAHREIHALQLLEESRGARPAAAAPSAMIPHALPRPQGTHGVGYELGHALLTAADEAIYGARSTAHAGPQPIDDAVRDIFELSHAYFVASNGFTTTPRTFEWGAAAHPAPSGSRDAAAIDHWFYLLAHGTGEADGIGVANASLVLYHAIANGQLHTGTGVDAFPSAVARSATQLFGEKSREVSAVGRALGGSGIVTEALVNTSGSPSGGIISINPCILTNTCVTYNVYPADGTTGYDPWSTYFSISPMPSNANLTEFQVSTDPSFTNDPNLAYSFKTVACGQVNQFTHTTFVSTACSAVGGVGEIILKPQTKYYWRWRTNPGTSLTTWTGWSSPTSFTTAAKQVTISGPGTGGTAVNAQFPWGVPFTWSNTPDGTVGFDLLVSEDCTLSGPRVNAGAATQSSQVMDLNMTDPNKSSATMDLDNHKKYCWSVVPNGPKIGPNANPGSPAMVGGAYPAFTTSGAKAMPAQPLNAATGVAPWNEQFKWNTVQAATGYHVDIAQSDTFATLMKCTIKAGTPTQCLGDKMKPNTQYFWRVQALGPTDPRTQMPRLGDYNDTTVTASPNPSVIDPPWQPSTALSFTTSDGVVTLQSPTNGGTLDPSQLTFAWADNNADSYVLEITNTPGQYEIQSGAQEGNPIPGVSWQHQVDSMSSCSDPTSCVVCSNGTCTYTVTDPLVLNTKYWWRVQGFALGNPGAWSNYGNDWSFTVAHTASACISPCNGESDVVDPWPVKLKFKRVPGAKKYHLTLTNFVPENNADDGHLFPSWTSGVTLAPIPNIGATYTFTDVIPDPGSGTVVEYDQWVRAHPQLPNEAPNTPGAHHWDVVVEYTDGSMSQGFSQYASFVVHDEKPIVWGPTMTCPNASWDPVPGANSYNLYACDFGTSAPTDAGPAFDNPWELDCERFGVPTQVGPVAPGNVTTINFTWPSGHYVLIASTASPADSMGNGGHNAADPQPTNAGTMAPTDGMHGNGMAGPICYGQ